MNHLWYVSAVVNVSLVVLLAMFVFILSIFYASFEQINLKSDLSNFHSLSFPHFPVELFSHFSITPCIHVTVRRVTASATNDSVTWLITFVMCYMNDIWWRKMNEQKNSTTRSMGRMESSAASWPTGSSASSLRLANARQLGYMRRTSSIIQLVSISVYRWKLIAF